MKNKLTRDQISQTLSFNMQDWKENADICEAQDLNEELTIDEIITICSPTFYDELHAEDDLFNVLENNFMDTDLCVYSIDTFILIHNIYNH
ncbi:hypothetical protein [Salmonella phage NINP13076]|nr:hypothetical protein [Salmonella phage NINP13076]